MTTILSMWYQYDNEYNRHDDNDFNAYSPYLISCENYSNRNLEDISCIWDRVCKMAGSDIQAPIPRDISE